MVFNIIKIGLLITAAQFIMASGCKRNDTTPCINGTPRYSFTATSEFFPQKEVYNVGDTIYLTSTIPKILTDQVSNQLVDYSNCLGIAGSLGFVRLDSVLRQGFPARDSFSTSITQGSMQEYNIVINRLSGFNVFYLESTSYSLKCAIVCKKKGIYSTGFGSAGSKGFPNKNCTNASFDMTVTNSDKHFNLFQNAMGIPIDTLGAKTSYCFRVQ